MRKSVGYFSCVQLLLFPSFVASTSGFFAAHVRRKCKNELFGPFRLWLHKFSPRFATYFIYFDFGKMLRSVSCECGKCGKRSKFLFLKVTRVFGVRSNARTRKQNKMKKKRVKSRKSFSGKVATHKSETHLAMKCTMKYRIWHSILVFASSTVCIYKRHKILYFACTRSKRERMSRVSEWKNEKYK